jgi:hypothetical protein
MALKLFSSVLDAATRCQSATFATVIVNPNRIALETALWKTFHDS